MVWLVVEDLIRAMETGAAGVGVADRAEGRFPATPQALSTASMNAARHTTTAMTPSKSATSAEEVHSLQRSSLATERLSLVSKI